MFLALKLHCLDVAAVVQALIQRTAFGQMLGRAASQALTLSDWEVLVRAAFWHDLGKCNAGFQAKAGGVGPFAGHTREIAGLLGRTDLPPALAFLSDAPRAPHTSQFWLLLAAASHHGDPLKAGLGDWGGLTERARSYAGVWSARDGYSPIDAIHDMAETADDVFGPGVGGGSFDWLLDAACEDTSGTMFLHAFAGLVSLADWIASNPDDSFFPYEGPGAGHSAIERWAWAQRRAETVIRAMRLDVSELRSGLREQGAAFGTVFDFDPRDTQTAMDDLSLGPIVCLEAPTGSGKTEAAIWRFKALFEAGLVDSLYMALPMRIAARQIHARLVAAFARLFPDARLRPNIVLAVPGYIVEGEDQAEKLARFEVLWPDGDADKAHLRWAAENTKRYLAAAVAVGTIDQALLAGLQTRHAHMRGAALARTLLVVDEIHASDQYQTELLRSLLERHVALGGHALLMSATLGGAARARLIAPHALEAAAPTEAEAKAAPYPAISDAAGVRDVAATLCDREIALETQPWMRDATAVAEQALAAAAAGAMVLVVRNTASGAIEVQRALEALIPDGQHGLLFNVDGVACPHHGRFAAPDRRVLDGAVERAFGKVGAPRRGLILIGTQTLEVSLDIDADFLISDLAPADVLLQRLGRLHRHVRTSRPAAFANPRAVILTPADRDLTRFLGPGRTRSDGLGTVYRNVLTLEATWRLLERRPTWRTPQDNRLIVENSTHPARLRALADALGPAWTRHEGEGLGASAASTHAARRQALDWSVPWDEQPWLGDDALRAQTRLGLDAARVRFDAPVRSPFGQHLGEIAVPGWMLDGPARDAPVAHETTPEGFVFEVAGRRLAYSRLGLEIAP